MFSTKIQEERLRETGITAFLVKPIVPVRWLKRSERYGWSLPIIVVDCIFFSRKCYTFSRYFLALAGYNVGGEKPCRVPASRRLTF
jgi:hypothetical protein